MIFQGEPDRQEPLMSGDVGGEFLTEDERRKRSLRLQGLAADSGTQKTLLTSFPSV